MRAHNVNFTAIFRLPYIGRICFSPKVLHQSCTCRTAPSQAFRRSILTLPSPSCVLDALATSIFLLVLQCVTKSSSRFRHQLDRRPTVDDGIGILFAMFLPFPIVSLAHLNAVCTDGTAATSRVCWMSRQSSCIYRPFACAPWSAGDRVQVHARSQRLAGIPFRVIHHISPYRPSIGVRVPATAVGIAGPKVPMND